MGGWRDRTSQVGRKPRDNDPPADPSSFARTDRGWAEGLFTLDVSQGDNVGQDIRARVFHAFSDPAILWRGTAYEVPQDETITSRRNIRRSRWSSQSAPDR